ncbi:MAG: TonB family protein [Betaproteobacteria bacterium]
MDYAYQQRRPTRHLVGIGGVILLHVLIVWALISGLARKVVEVVKGPIEVKVIEEVVQKPPPPPEVLPPPPKIAAPPPPFIPPPEINIAPPPAAPTISAVTREAPPAPQAPVIARPVEAPKAAPPRVQSAQVVCQNYREVMGSIVYPREALREGLEGEVLIEFTVGANGQVKDVVIAKSTNRVFNRVALRAAESMNCQGQGHDIRVQLPVGFKLQ